MENNIVVWNVDANSTTPLAVFGKGSQAINRFAWLCEGNAIVSCSKDGTLCISQTLDAYRPLDRRRGCPLSFAPNGDLAFADDAIPKVSSMHM
jgi:WD40 repeat protein